MARIRYSTDYDLLAYRAIALSGLDRAAYETIGIPERTFYLWLSKHESFKESVLKAREFNRRTSPEALRLALVNHIAAILENGGESVRTTTRTTTRTIQRDRHNRLINTIDTETLVETTEFKGIPKWVSDKVMGNASNLTEAIRKVLASGYDVVSEKDEDELAAGVEYN